jgi:hypothetical protein
MKLIFEPVSVHRKRKVVLVRISVKVNDHRMDSLLLMLDKLVPRRLLTASHISIIVEITATEWHWGFSPVCHHSIDPPPQSVTDVRSCNKPTQPACGTFTSCHAFCWMFYFNVYYSFFITLLANRVSPYLRLPVRCFSNVSMLHALGARLTQKSASLSCHAQLTVLELLVSVMNIANTAALRSGHVGPGT